MPDNSFIQLVECPRDAMQGWKHFIPTAQKTAYINSLLQVGFDTIDVGSFVSPKAIPQMADTAAVLKGLDMTNTHSKLLTIVANLRGAEEAVLFDEVSYLGFPFSISETFQQRNTNSSIEESLTRTEDIQELCVKNNKELVLYISMAFGNPYGDPYSPELVTEWVDKLQSIGIKIFSLADTVGLAQPEDVFTATRHLLQQLPQHQVGVHLHSSPVNWQTKVEAALRAGCRRFDGALKGIGGCPMAGDELVGNMDTELLIAYFRKESMLPAINEAALDNSSRLAAALFV